MIDVCMVIHKNYELLDLQKKHISRLKGATRLLAMDNTPEPFRKPTDLPHMTVGGIDGMTHGLVLDELMKVATSDIVCVQDSDFFWLNKNIIEEVENYFKLGFKCVGCAGFYPDWQTNLDPRHPDRAGYLAPVCWGMFVDRKLAMEQTFSVTAEEAATVHETGWRLRQRLIQEQIPTVVFQGCYPDGWTDKECCFFTHQQKLQGVHLLKGSAGRSALTDQLPKMIEEFMC
jgi:hypothetical protein